MWASGFPAAHLLPWLQGSSCLGKIVKLPASCGMRLLLFTNSRPRDFFCTAWLDVHFSLSSTITPPLTELIVRMWFSVSIGSTQSSVVESGVGSGVKANLPSVWKLSFCDYTAHSNVLQS